MRQGALSYSVALSLADAVDAVSPMEWVMSCCHAKALYKPFEKKRKRIELRAHGIKAAVAHSPI